MLYEEATHAKVPVSLATVYNTLHQFTEVGLIATGGGRRLEGLFRHQQFRAPQLLIEDQNDLIDIPADE